MFRTNNFSSSGGLYNQLTVFHHAFNEESSGWHDTDTFNWYYTKRYGWSIVSCQPL